METELAQDCTVHINIPVNEYAGKMCITQAHYTDGSWYTNQQKQQQHDYALSRLLLSYRQTTWSTHTISHHCNSHM